VCVYSVCVLQHRGEVKGDAPIHLATGVLQRCCTVLKCVACCSVLQCLVRAWCVAVLLQACCSCVAGRCIVLFSVCCSVFQCVAVCFSVLQCFGSVFYSDSTRAMYKFSKVIFTLISHGTFSSELIFANFYTGRGVFASGMSGRRAGRISGKSVG